LKFSDYPCVYTICHPISCDIILSVTILSVILLSVILSIYHTSIDSIIMYRTHIRTRIYRHHYIPQTSLYSSTYSPVCGGCSRISYHTYSFASQHSFVSHAFIRAISYTFIRTICIIPILRIHTNSSAPLHPHHTHSSASHAFIRTTYIHSPTRIYSHDTHLFDPHAPNRTPRIHPPRA